ncbi:MAG: hypothetical protein AAGB51_05750 [Planctomycetota bacterium]
MAKRTPRKRRPSAPKQAPRTKNTDELGELSTEALQAELRRRQRSTRSLERKRERLLEQLRDVEAELAAHGAPITASGGVRKRPKNDMNLEEALASVLTGSTMGVTEAAEAVQRAGYMTSSANFRTIVNQTLIRSKKFKKISRGQYTAR